MNILVVDDEFYIVQGIIKNTNWESLGVNEVFPAYSAKQAQKIIETNEIDLLLTDIEMPGENGFELIEWIQKEHYNILPVILTSHQRFDYAQKAISMHCLGYILKPIEKVSFENELREIIKNSQNAPKADYPQDEERLSNNDQIIKEANDNQFMKSIQRLIYANLSSPELNRNFLATALHMNPDYLSYIFHVKFGQTLTSYITSVRIDTAKELLINTTMTLQNISDHSGFSDCSYFHRQFKRLTGMTPQQYRSKHQ